MTFATAVERLCEDSSMPFPLKGPRAMRSYMTSLRSANQDFSLHHEFFLRKSGLSDRSAVAKEHRHLHEAFRLAIEADQLDVSNSAAFEYLCRRVVQIESAVKRNPKRPDFEGLDSVLDSAVEESGAAVVADFTKRVGEKQAAEARILRAGREWREERQTVAKSKKDKKEGE